MEYKGEAPNKHLLQGPDLSNKLVGVLARFRKEPVAFMADIEAMFLQVHVTEHYRDLLRSALTCSVVGGWRLKQGNEIQNDCSSLKGGYVPWLLKRCIGEDC